MLKILGLFSFVLNLLVVGFVFHDAYFRKRYNLGASILWILFVLLTPFALAIPLYILFRPNRDITRGSLCIEPNDEFLKKKYLLLDRILLILFLFLWAYVLFLFIKIIPAFNELFKGFDIRLPILTLIIIKLSNFVWIWGLLIPILTVFLFVKFKHIIRNSAPRSYVILIISFWLLWIFFNGIMGISMNLPTSSITQIK